MTQQINRRTVTKGIAWSVPAVALASAAPAFASSGKEPTLAYKGACKYPGNQPKCVPQFKQAYGFVFEVKNNDPLQAVYFCGASLSNMSGDLTTPPTFVPQAECVKVEPNQTGHLYFFFESTNSQNLNFTADMTVEWGHECPCSADENEHGDLFIPNVQVTDTPPGGLCQCIAPFIPTGGTMSLTHTGEAATMTATAVATPEAEVTETPADIEAVDEVTEVVETEAVEPTVTETEEPFVEADVQEPVEQTEVVEETN